MLDAAIMGTTGQPIPSTLRLVRELTVISLGGLLALPR